MSGGHTHNNSVAASRTTTDQCIVDPSNPTSSSKSTLIVRPSLRRKDSMMPLFGTLIPLSGLVRATSESDSRSPHQSAFLLRDLVAPVRPPSDFPDFFVSLRFGDDRNELPISADMPESIQI